eukprot:m.342705 g.342705  ORF g.342705 m.342705 type:complete len:1072 (-) comp21748_c0_seq1:59-3274(-)
MSAELPSIALTDDVRGLLFEFQELIPPNDASTEYLSESFANIDQYWLLLELKFTLRAMAVSAYQNFESVSLLGRKYTVINSKPAREAQNRLHEILSLLSFIEKAEDMKTNADAPNESQLPRDVRLARALSLSRYAHELFQLMTVMATAKTRAFSTQMLAYTDMSSLLFVELCAMTKTELEDFYDDDHKYIRDGVILVDTSYDNEKTPRMSAEVARALRGWPLTQQQELKLAGTDVLKVCGSENLVAASDGTTAVAAKDTTTTNEKEALSELEALLAQSEAVIAQTPKIPEADDDTMAEDSDEAEEPTEEELLKLPYTSALEYLDDMFQMVTGQIKLSRERLRREMRDVIGDADVQPWEREQRGVRRNVREYEAKLRLIRNRIDVRLKVTIDKQEPMPRLITLCNRLGFDEFERSVIVLLVGSTVSPLVKEVLKNFENGVNKYDPNDFITVKLILQAFCVSFKEQVAHRKYFYKSGNLVRTGILRLSGSVYSRNIETDLTNQIAVLDRRMLDWIVGLDTEINEVVDGTNLYTPNVTWDDVILPKDKKKKIMDTVTSFQAFKSYQKAQTLSKENSKDTPTKTGLGLVFLFSGPSGTGKTLTVNAIAASLKKRVLLVNFNAMVDSNRGSNGGAAVQSIFREGSMHDAVVFFDECESLFAQRGRGSGGSALNDLLTEIERHEGLIFLATNRPFDLDEAMHRRITASFEFRAPHFIERKSIWALHTEKDNIKLAPDIDWGEIALRYELAGGFIKNAVMSALLTAVTRDGPENPTVQQKDLEEGCELQMRGSLRMKSFSNRVVPTSGLSSLVLPTSISETLMSVVDLEKARGVLMGQWGFDERLRDQQSTTVLLWGPSGTGKSSASEALGFEIGRPLKVLSFTELMAMRSEGDWTSDGSALRTVFSDAALMGAVVVIEGFESVLQQEMPTGASTLALNNFLYEMGRYRGVVIVIVTSARPFSQVCHNLNPEVLRKFKVIVEFELPSAKLRERLWQMMLPSKAPKSKEIDFTSLSQSYKFSGGQISRVAYRAAAFAAVRKPSSKKEPMIEMEDLVHACKDEEERTEGDMAKLVQQWFL